MCRAASDEKWANNVDPLRPFSLALQHGKLDICSAAPSLGQEVLLVYLMMGITQITIVGERK